MTDTFYRLDIDWSKSQKGLMSILCSTRKLNYHGNDSHLDLTYWAKNFSSPFCVKCNMSPQVDLGLIPRLNQTGAKGQLVVYIKTYIPEKTFAWRLVILPDKTFVFVGFNLELYQTQKMPLAFKHCAKKKQTQLYDHHHYNLYCLLSF